MNQIKNNTAERHNVSESVSRLKRMRALGDEKPAVHFGRVPGKKQKREIRKTLPMKKPWPVIIILGILAAAFSTPLFLVSSMKPDTITNLFELVFFIFTLLWMLGWATAVLVMFGFLLILLFARENIVFRSDRILIRMEWFGLGIGSTYLKKNISNLHVSNAEKGGNSWRGNHLVFDYLGVPVPLGSKLDSEQQIELMQHFNSGAGTVSSGTVESSGADEITAAVVRDGDVHSRVSASDVTVEEAREIRSSSSFLLILANIVPVAGVLLLGWNIGDLMLLFWIESAIIGFFNVLKIIMVGRWAAIFYAPFFIGHFGGFMAVHLLFVFTLFVGPVEGDDLATTAAAFLALWPAIVSLFISHGFSFCVNFLGRMEYTKRTVKQQMSEPYKRVIVMHVTILFGGFMVMALSNTLAPLILLIGLKLVLDLYAHHNEHRDESEKQA